MLPRRRETMAISFKGAHFPQDIMLMGVRWYVAYPLSTRHVEELMLERGVHVDHSTINRWVVKYSPLLEEAFHRRKRPVWVSWRMDETYIKVKGQWYYLYRAVDKHGQTIDFLLTEHRDKEAALRFLKKAIRRNGVPETITIDGSDANERRFPQPKIDQHFGSSREAHGYWKTTGRFHNQGMTWLGWSRAASRRIGLWQRLSKCTTIRSGWMSTTPAVSTNLRYSCLGAAVSKPRRCLASH